MSSYRIASPLAMAASVISGALSILLLIEPQLAHEWSLSASIGVAVSVGLVLLTICTGVLAHGFGLTAKGVVLAAVSLAGSGLIVWEQSGRRAQVHVASSVSAEDVARERKRLLQKRAEADEILPVHRAAQARECASGKGKRCDGITYTVSTWEAAVAGYDAKLAKLPSPAPDAKTERVATAAGLLRYDAKTARAWVSLLDPLLFPLWLELCSVICGIFAVSIVRRLETGVETRTSPAPAPVVRAIPETKAIAHLSPVRRETDEARVLRALRSRGGQIGSQDELGLVIGVCKSEVSKMLKNCANVERIRVDNKNVIRIKESA